MGEALVALQHEDLKAMGINSVGHRLTILKSVYDVKKAQDVPIESDHYMPLSTPCLNHAVLDALTNMRNTQPPRRKPSRQMRR